MTPSPFSKSRDFGACAAGATLLALAALNACSASPKLQSVNGDLAIVGATVIDGTDAEPAHDQTIVVAGDSIVAIAASASLTPNVKSTVDARGKYVIPGLWDMHVHLTQWDEAAFPMFVVNGVTSIRDMGDSVEFQLAWKDSSAKRLPFVPTMLIAGPVLDDELIVRAVAGTPLGSGRWAVSDSTSGARAVDSLAKLGVDHIKVHSMTPRAAYNGIIASARAHGLYVVGHTPDNMMPEDAIAAGQRTIEHNTEIAMEQAKNGRAIHDWAWASMAPAIATNRAKKRPNFMEVVVWRFRGADSASAVFDSATAATFATKVSKLPVWFDPTLVVMEIFTRGREPGVLDTTALKYVAPKAVGFTDSGEEKGPPPTPAEIALGKKQWENALRSVRAMAQGGAKFITGTDVPIAPLVPGFSLHREMQHLVSAGLTPKQALQAATRNSADAAGKLATTGTVERGKRADFVVLDADPLASIANTTRINAVVSHGHLLPRTTIDSVLTAYESRAKPK